MNGMGTVVGADPTSTHEFADRAVAAAENMMIAVGQRIIDGDATTAEAISFLTFMRLNRLIAAADQGNLIASQQAQETARGLLGPIR